MAESTPTGYIPPLDVRGVARAAKWFGLMPTHELELQENHTSGMRRSTLLIFTLGFLKGLRLVPVGWGHFYRVPTKPQQLQDFYVEEEAVIRVLNLACRWWEVKSGALRKLLVGALHWQSFGPSYEHPFERFNAAYIVLDTCWKIHCLIRGTKDRAFSHSARAEAMINHYHLAMPNWAVTVKGQSALSRFRNALLHEGLWGEEPIGFAHPKEHRLIHDDLHRLNSRLLLALLGDTSSYIGSSVTRRAMTLLR